MTTGEKIKAARKKAGLTQKELGAMLGISQAAIVQFERKDSNMKLDTIRKIADALGVKLYELVDDWSKFSHEELLHDFIQKSNSEDELDAAEEMLKSLENNYREKYPLSERLIASYELLNEAGKEKAVIYIEDLSKIPEYQNTEVIENYASDLTKIPEYRKDSK